MIAYFDVEGIPGNYFACTRYGTMSVASCAKNYATAPKAFKASGRLEGCLGCATGCAHAAGAQPGDIAVVAPPIAPVEMVYKPVCLRCRHSGRENTSRLVGRMRLVRDHTICVSCYNREREVLQGVNAKGAKPKKWSHLFSPHAAYVKGERVIRQRTATPVVDRIELALTLVRSAGAAGVFWCASPIVLLA